MSSFGRQTATILGKELRIELRTREIIYTMLFFGLVIVVVFGFGLFEKRSAALAAPGILWVALLLAGTVSVGRTFEREREGSCMTGLMLVPGIAWPLFLGKMISNLLFLLMTLVFVVPLVLLVFQFTHVSNPGGVALTLFLGALGYSILGTLVGGMLSQVSMRGILLPLVLFPMILPVFGVGVTATADLLAASRQTVEIRLTEVQPGQAIGVVINGQHVEVTPREGDTPSAVAYALAEHIERGVDTASLPTLTVAHASGEAGLTLLGTPGALVEIEPVGVQAATLTPESKGWGYLPVLAALDFFLLLVSMWLFGRLVETA